MRNAPVITYEPVFKKRLKAEVNAFIQTLHKENIQVQMEGQNEVAEIKQNSASDQEASTTRSS